MNKMIKYQWCILPLAAAVILGHNNWTRFNNYMSQKFPSQIQVPSNIKPRIPFEVYCPGVVISADAGSELKLASAKNDEACLTERAASVCAGSGYNHWKIAFESYDINGIDYKVSAHGNCYIDTGVN